MGTTPVNRVSFGVTQSQPMAPAPRFAQASTTDGNDAYVGSGQAAPSQTGRIVRLASGVVLITGLVVAGRYAIKERSFTGGLKVLWEKMTGGAKNTVENTERTAENTVKKKKKGGGGGSSSWVAQPTASPIARQSEVVVERPLVVERPITDRPEPRRTPVTTSSEAAQEVVDNPNLNPLLTPPVVKVKPEVAEAIEEQMGGREPVEGLMEKARAERLTPDPEVPLSHSSTESAGYRTPAQPSPNAIGANLRDDQLSALERLKAQLEQDELARAGKGTQVEASHTQGEASGTVAEQMEQAWKEHGRTATGKTPGQLAAERQVAASKAQAGDTAQELVTQVQPVTQQALQAQMDRVVGLLQPSGEQLKVLEAIPEDLTKASPEQIGVVKDYFTNLAEGLAEFTRMIETAPSGVTIRAFDEEMSIAQLQQSLRKDGSAIKNIFPADDKVITELKAVGIDLEAILQQVFVKNKKN